MKVFERQVLRQQVSSTMDPLQFAYQDKVGVDDVIIYQLHRASSHLEGSESTVKVMFFYFSSPTLDLGVPDRQATVRPTTACNIRPGGGEQRRTSENGAVTIPVHHLHL